MKLYEFADGTKVRHWSRDGLVYRKGLRGPVRAEHLKDASVNYIEFLDTLVPGYLERTIHAKKGGSEEKLPF